MAKTYGGRWKVLREVGTGGQSNVFLVEDATGVLSGHYALKRLRNRERLDLFQREVAAISCVDHPNVLRIVDSDVKADPAYYVAEYCEGGSLADDPDRYRADVCAFAVVRAVADALVASYAAGVTAHRDVKPANVLFRKDETPVLGDFGICHMVGDDRVTLSGEAMGSKDYIAPEMESGRHGPVTSAADVYALGKMIYWMLSGGSIFAREDHRALKVYLPSILRDKRWEHVHAVLDHMILTDPKARWTFDKLNGWFSLMPQLISGWFTPLRRSMGPRCRFCGLGEYGEWAALKDWLNGHDFHALRCSNCGHVEMFHLKGSADAEWWNR